MKRFIIVLTLMMLFVSQQIFAADILFVSDSTTDSNIPTVLTGDGHSVTVVTNDYDNATQNNPTLQGDLSMYDSVFWSATGTGYGGVHAAATFTNLSNYVSGGGDVFVTGYDSISSPDDPNLLAFIGGVANIDGGSPNGSVINVANYLTTGMIDIRGVTPTGGYTSDMDTVDGLLVSTVGVVPSTDGGGDGYVWTLRSLGNGFIAYVSNGANLSSGQDPHPSWTNTSPGGDGAYNAALRNFAFNATGALESVSGTISYTGVGTGPISIAAFDGNGCGDGNFSEVWIPGPGAYTLNLSPGTYHICACRDTNQNGTCPDSGEPASGYDGNPITVTEGGEPITGINIALEGQPQRVESVPTVTEWGMLIFMVLAGLGSVYYLKRQRRA